MPKNFTTESEPKPVRDSIATSGAADRAWIPEQRQPSEPCSDLSAPEPESAWETFLWSRPTTKPRWILRLVLAPAIWLVGSILGIIDIAREDGWR